MSVHRGHVFLLFFGVIFLVSKYSVEAYRCKKGCSPFQGLTPLLTPAQDPVEVKKVSQGDYEDLLGEKGISINQGLLRNVVLSSLQLPTDSARFIQHDEEEEGGEVKQVNKSPKTHQQEGEKPAEELEGRAKVRQPELDKDEEKVNDEEKEYEGEDSVGSQTSVGSSKKYVVRGKHLYISNLRGVRLRVSSPLKQQRIAINGNTVTVNGRMVCNNIRKLRKKQTHQIASDGAKWYTNLKVGKPMTKAEIQQFKKEGIEREEEERRNLQQSVGEKTQNQEEKDGVMKNDGAKWFTNSNVGKLMATAEMQQFSQEGIGREEEQEEDNEEGRSLQQSEDRKTPKQELRDQQRREKDQKRDLKRRQEEEEKLWIKEQRERLRREKQQVKENAHNQKEALKEKLRELENTGLGEIRRQKDEIRDKLRTQKSYLKEIETKL